MEVSDDQGQHLVAQVDLVWDRDGRPSTSQYTLHFVANVQGFGITTYFIRPARHATLSSVIEYSSNSGSSGAIVGDWHYEHEHLDGTREIIVENSFYLCLLY